jgi:hypothetical protein
MRTPLALLVSLILAAGCAGEPGGGGEDAATTPDTAEAGPTGPSGVERLEDPEVRRIWTQMMDSIAPEDGWARTRYVAFDWVVDRGEGEPLRRSHAWDVWDGRYRVEAPVDDGTMVALFDVNDPTGTEEIWIDGEPVTDPARSDTLVDRAHSMFINDSYWLLMPFKWADPGVTASYLGEMETWGETWEVVELTFDGVGRTPGNKYRAFVDPETGMMGLWQHFRSADDPEPAFTMAWTDWEDYGPILLSSRRPDREGDSRIYFEELAADTRVPEGVFQVPGDAPGEDDGGAGE